MQMVLIEHDDVVQTFPTDGADQALDKRILPRGSGGNELLFQAQAVSLPLKFQAINAVAVSE